MEQIVVGAGDCRISNNPRHVLATFGLGSCVCLSIYDPAARLGGLLHFVQPDSSIDPARGASWPYRFADTGIPLLLDELYRRGAEKSRLLAYVVGAARMSGRDPFEIGRRNYTAARRLLERAGILLQGEAVGGRLARTIYLEVGTGRIRLQEGSAGREFAAIAPLERGLTE